MTFDVVPRIELLVMSKVPYLKVELIADLTNLGFVQTVKINVDDSVE